MTKREKGFFFLKKPAQLTRSSAQYIDPGASESTWPPSTPHDVTHAVTKLRASVNSASGGMCIVWKGKWLSFPDQRQTSPDHDHHHDPFRNDSITSRRGEGKSSVVRSCTETLEAFHRSLLILYVAVNCSKRNVGYRNGFQLNFMFLGDAVGPLLLHSNSSFLSPFFFKRKGSSSMKFFYYLFLVFFSLYNFW